MAALNDLLVKVGVEGLPAFKGAFKDAIEALETTGDRALRVGTTLSKAFSSLGVSDASAQIVTQAKKIQQSFDQIRAAKEQGKATDADYNKALEETRVKLLALTNTAEPLVAKIQRVNEAFSRLGVRNTDFQITAQVNALKKDLDTLDKEFKDGVISQKDFAAATKVVTAELDKLTKVNVVSFTDKLKNLEAIGSTLRRAGQSLTVGLTAPLTAISGLTLKFAADFELAMRQVTSLMGDLGDASFKPLSNGVLELSKRMGVDAVGAAHALYEAISAGVPKENALAFLEVASTAAIAGVTSTKVAVDGMTSIINAYQLDLSKAGEVSDAMFQAVNLGKFTFEQLAASIATAIPQAAQLGIGFKEILAAATTLTSKGVPVSEAMTQIAAAMRSIIDPSKQMTALFDKIGVSSGQALLKARGFQGALEAIREATGGNIQVLSDATGRIEGFNAILSLTGANAKKAKDDLDGVNNSINATGKAFEQINKSFSRQLEILLSQAKVVAIEFGQSLLPLGKEVLKGLQPLLNTIATIVQAFLALPDPVKTATIAIASFAAAVGPITFASGAIASGVADIAKAFGLLAGVGSGSGSTGGLAGFVTSLKSLPTLLKSVSVAALDAFVVWPSKLPGTVSILGSLKDAILAIPGAFKSLAIEAVAAFGTIATAIRTLNFAAVGAAITQAFAGVTTLIANIAFAVSNNLVGALSIGEKAVLAIGKAGIFAAAAFGTWKLAEWAYNAIPAVHQLADSFSDLVLKIPVIGTAIKKLLDLLPNAGKAAAEAATEEYQKATQKTADFLKSQGVVVEKGTKTWEQYNVALREAALQMKGMSPAAFAAKQSVAETQAEVKNLTAELKKADDALEDIKKRYKQGNASALDVAKATEKVRQAYAALHPTIHGTGEELAVTTKRATELAAAFTKLKIDTAGINSGADFQLKALTDAVGTIEKAFLRGSKAADGHKLTLADVRAAYDALETETDKLAQKNADSWNKVVHDSDKALSDLQVSLGKASRDLHLKALVQLEVPDLQNQMKIVLDNVRQSLAALKGNDVKVITDALNAPIGDSGEGKATFEQIKAASDWAHRLNLELKELRGNQESLTEKARKSAQAYRDLQDAVDGFKPNPAHVTQFQADLAEVIKLSDEINRLREEAPINPFNTGKLQDAQTRIKQIKSDLASIRTTEDAFGELGLKSVTDLEIQVKRTTEAIKVLGKEGTASALDMQVAQRKLLEQQIELAKATGRPWADLEVRLQQINSQIDTIGKNKGFDSLHASAANFLVDFNNSFRKLADGVGDALANALFHPKSLGSALKTLWGTFKTSMEDALKDALKTAFIDPIINGLKKAMSNVITNFLGGLSGGISKALGGLIPGGSSSVLNAASNATRGTQNVNAALGGLGGTSQSSTSAASSLSSLSSVTGIVGAAAGVANAVISGIGFARLEGTLNQIERNTAAASIHLTHILDGINKYLPSLTDIKSAWYQYFEYFASLMSTVEQIRDRIVGQKVGETPTPVFVNRRFDGITETAESAIGTDKTDLERIYRSIETGTQRIVDAILTASSGVVQATGDVGKTGTQSGKTLDDIKTQQAKLQQASDKLLAAVPEDIRKRLAKGETPVTDNENWSKAIAEYQSIKASLDAINASVTLAQEAGQKLTTSQKGGGSFTGNDLIEENTRKCFNELSNLRADMWTREAHWYVRTGEMWAAIQDVTNYLSHEVNDILHEIRDSIRATTSAAEITGEAFVATTGDLSQDLLNGLADLGNQLVLQMASDTDQIKRTIGEAVSSLISNKGGSGAGGFAMGTALNQTFAELQFKVMDAKERQEQLLGQMSAEVAAALRGGRVPTPITAADERMLEQFNNLADIIRDLSGEILRLKGLGAGTTPTPAPRDVTATTPAPTPGGTSVDYETGSLDTSKTTKVVTTGAGVISGGTDVGVDASGLYDMLNKQLSMLNETAVKILTALGGGGAASPGGSTTLPQAVGDVTKSLNGVTEAVTAVGVSVTDSNDVLKQGIGGLLSDSAEEWGRIRQMTEDDQRARENAVPASMGIGTDALEKVTEAITTIGSEITNPSMSRQEPPWAQVRPQTNISDLTDGWQPLTYTSSSAMPPSTIKKQPPIQVTITPLPLNISGRKVGDVLFDAAVRETGLYI